MSNDVIVIVNAYLSGAFYAPLFIEKGYQCVHVTTAMAWKNESYQATFRENDFIKTVIANSEDDFAEILAELAKFKIKLIIPGIESGVSLADNLAHHFNVSINDYSLSSARRNKFDMQEALKNNNVRSISQIKTSSVEAAIQWKHKNNLQKIVLKPLSSASSDSVFYCFNDEDVKNKFSFILNNKNMFGKENQEVLVQEYIDGFEYIVNTVSQNGKHLIVDIWKGYSLDPNQVSNDIYADALHTNEPEYPILQKYIEKALSAVGIQNGPAHSEVRMDNKGACLIEVGARLAGRVDFSTVEEIYGCSQLSLSVQAFLEPLSFHEIYPRQYARYVYFFSNVEGLICSDIDTNDFKNLETLFSLKLFLRKNDMLKKTSKPLGIKRPGYAYLISNDPVKVEHDYLLIKKLEGEFYKKIVGENHEV